MAAPRRLQNTCLEPSDASHVYTSGRDHSFAFQFRYTLGLDTISCGCERGDVQRAGGRRRPPFDRVLGGFGAWIDKEPFDGVPAVQKRGKVVVRYLGPREPLTSHIGGYIGGYIGFHRWRGRCHERRLGCRLWLRTHGSRRVPVLPAISADEYARTHFAPLDGAAGAPVAAAAPAQRRRQQPHYSPMSSPLGERRADEHARTLSRSGTAARQPPLQTNTCHSVTQGRTHVGKGSQRLKE